MGQKSAKRRGIVLTLDIAIAMMLLLVVIASAYSAYGSPSRAGFDAQLMRSYLQDAATIMAKKEYFADAASQNGSNTTGIREVLRATPSTICMQVSGFGTVVGSEIGAYWKFDEGSGSIVTDSSGNGHIATLYGGASLSGTGKSGFSMAADGSTGYADTGYDVGWDENTPASISFWLKPAATSGPGTSEAGIMGKAYPDWEWAFYQSGNAVDFVYWNSTGGHGNGMDAGWGGVLLPGQWTHLAYVWNGTTSQFYADGQLVNTQAAANASTNQDRANSMVMGGHVYVWADKYFNGSLDDVRVYNRALTGDEVRLLYSNPSNLLFAVDKPECAYSGGEVQTLTVPFVSNEDQDEDEYYYATLRAWLAGANK